MNPRPSPSDSPSPSAFIYSSCSKGPVSSSIMPQQRHAAQIEEEEDAVPEPHDLNDPLINPMFPSLAPLGLSSQSYRREAAPLRPAFNNITNPVHLAPIATRPVELYTQTPPNNALASQHNGLAVVLDSSGGWTPVYGHMSMEHSPTTQVYQASPSVNKQIAGAYISLQSAHQPAVFQASRPCPETLGASGITETASCLHEPGFGNDTPNQDKRSESASSASYATFPSYIAHEIRTICLLATQQYLRTHAVHRHRRTTSRFSPYPRPRRSYTLTSVCTPNNSPRPGLVPGSGYHAGVELLLRKLTRPSDPHSTTPHSPSLHKTPAPDHSSRTWDSLPPSSPSNSTNTSDTIVYETEPPSCVASLLKNTTNICTLLWRTAQRTRDDGPGVGAERRAAAHMRVLLGWAETIAFFEGYGDDDGEKEGEESTGVDGGEVLQAAEGFCEFLGDEYGVKRIGELVWG